MRRGVLSLAILVLGWAISAEAAPVIELEVDGTASNNSLATAQAIPPSAFTLPVPPTVFNPPGFRTAALFGRGGGPDVDIFRISGHGQLLLDVDNANLDSPHVDTVVMIFNSSGVQLAFSDDADFDDGSTNFHDSLLLFDLPKPGVYFVGITRYFNWAEGGSFDTAFVENGPQPNDEIPQQYLLYLSLEHPHRVSVPPTLAFLVCSVGLTVGARFLTRRRSR